MKPNTKNEKLETKSKEHITKDMTIGEVVAKYPESSSIMLNYGLHCVGCAVNPYESIENGCLGHGMEEETINKLVDDLNKSIIEIKDRIDKIVSITKKAVVKFNEFMKDDNKEGSVIRLKVYTDECCKDLKYTLDFTDKKEKTEEVYEDNGLKIFIDKAIISKIKGLKIDYVENERGSGFKIDNPNINSDSGCGSGSCGCSE